MNSTLKTTNAFVMQRRIFSGLKILKFRFVLILGIFHCLPFIILKYGTMKNKNENLRPQRPLQSFKRPNEFLKYEKQSISFGK